MSSRLPRNIQRQMDDVNAKLQARQRELDAQDAAEQAERHAQSAEYMADYRRRLAEKKQAEQAQRDAEFERQVAPLKRTKMLEWLIDHPGQSEADFELVWPHVRELLKVDDRDAAIQREIEAQKRRRY